MKQNAQEFEYRWNKLIEIDEMSGDGDERLIRQYWGHLGDDAVKEGWVKFKGHYIEYEKMYNEYKEKKKLLIGKRGWKLLMNTKFTTASGEKVQFNIKEGQKFLNTTLNKIWGKKLLDKKIGNYKIRTLITGIKEEEEQGGYGIPESFIANYWDDPDWKTNKINIEMF